MILPVALLAFLLGFKHSYDPDHIIAVSNLLTRTGSIRNVMKMCLSWAAGHMLTASVITILLYEFKEAFLSAFLSHFEPAVAIMLVLLGVLSFKGIGLPHTHKHHHDGQFHTHLHLHLKSSQDHYHKHMFGIGIVQGLASNDELLLLLTISLSLTTLFGILLGTAIFSIGVVLGMVAYGIILNHTLGSFNRKSISKVVNAAMGLSSIGYGVFLGLKFLL